MEADARSALCEPALVAVRDRHFARLEDLFAGRLGEAFFLNGVEARGAADLYSEPELWVELALEDLAARARDIPDDGVFRPLVVEPNPYGVHFVDRMFGAEVFTLDGGWQSRCLGSPPGELAEVDLDSDGTFRLAMRLARAFAASGAAAPLYGMPTIASALNIGVNLYGEELLVAMYESPAAARRDLALINSTLCELHRRHRGVIPERQLQPVVAAWRTQPPGFGQLCGCATQLISAETYREFVAPLDGELLAVHPGGGMIHLCGSHAQHIPEWARMPGLRAVQLNDRAAEDLELYRGGLRGDQVIYVNPCAGMPLDRILELTRGDRTVIVADRLKP